MKPAIAVMAVSVLLGSAPAAHADENAYFSELAQEISPPLTNTHATYLGMIACNELRDGAASGLTADQALVKAESAVATAQSELAIGLTKDDTANVVAAARDQIC